MRPHSSPSQRLLTTGTAPFSVDKVCTISHLIPALQRIRQLAPSLSRTLREEVYRAYITRGAVGDSDNGPIIESILALRHEQAQLVGYPSFAEYSMASKVRLSRS